MATLSAPSDLRSDLAEDLLAAWASDVAGLVDLEMLRRTDHSWSPPRPVQWLAVPSPKGGVARMPILHPFIHARLHETTQETRAIADRVLAPTVFGYRTGATANSRYAPDWRRFSDWVHDTAESGSAVVHADVRAFFHNVRWGSAGSAIARLGLETAKLEMLGAELSEAGLEYLPPGYSDARMLANLVLSDVDGRLSWRFARWVDDYRLAVRDRVEGESAIAELRRLLTSIGLELNESKTEFVAASDAARLSSNTLASVYHPERDPPAVVRRNLLAVFERALETPRAERRALRFCLHRFGKERDPVAIRAVLEGLTAWPWDAPRAVAYLSAVSDHPSVGQGVGRLLTAAAEDSNAWLVARLAPLSCRLDVGKDARNALAAAMPRFVGSPAWGLGLRVLSTAGDRRAVDVALRDAGPSDPRASLVAAADTGSALAAQYRRAEPILAELLRRQLAPLPSVVSIL